MLNLLAQSPTPPALEPNLVAQYGFIGILLLATSAAIIGLWRGVKWASERMIGTNGIVPQFLTKQEEFMEKVENSIDKLEITTTTLASSLEEKLDDLTSRYREDIKRMWEEAREDRKLDREIRHELFNKLTPIVTLIEAQMLKPITKV